MDIKQLKTSPDLLDKLEKAAQRRTQAGELVEQKISFVYGSVKAESGITREQVKRFIEQDDDLPMAHVG